ncbi:MAG: hypothetical protein J0H43_00460, partial [Actinobacteria bacterium]|nr:hypothetical protein [Actinomycetota bacterium]
MNVVELIISVLVFLVSARIVVDLNGKWGEQAWRRLFPDTPLGRAHRRFMGFAVIALCLASMFVFTRSLDVHTSNGLLQAISVTLAVLTFISICFALVAALFNWPPFASMPAHRDELGYFSDLRRDRQHAA